jgi:hypothetical protein
VPSLLSKRYEETKDYPDLSLKQYLADQGYEGDDVDCVTPKVTSEISMRMIAGGGVVVL